MQAETWEKFELIFEQAVQIADENERRRFVEECAGVDFELREAVFRLLENDRQEKFFLDEPVFSSGAQLIASLPEETDEAEELLIFRDKNFAHYHLLKILGRGGGGVVFLALDTRLSRRVALKLLPAALDNRPEIIARFRQEAKAASTVAHQNAAHIYDFGEFENRYFLAMEYVPGQTLRELLKKKSIEPEAAVDIALKIAAALEAAHKAGVIHRDIKPENVIVTEEGAVKVLDFGLAKISAAESFDSLETSLETMPGLIMGTTAYMSPEQVRAVPVDQTSDIWSLGVVFYEMLFRRRPFAGETPSDIRASILRDEPSWNYLDSGFNGVIVGVLKKCLHKDSAARYQSAADLIRDLKNLPARQDSGEFSSLPASLNAGETSTDSNIRHDTSGRKSGKSKTDKSAGSNKTNQRFFVFGGALLFLIILAAALYFSLYFSFDRSPQSSENSLQAQPASTTANSAAKVSANPEAEREYQSGIYIWNKRKTEEMPRALAHFQRAVELDPGYARAYAGLAFAYSWDGNPNLSETEKKTHVRAAVQRALALDPDLAEAHTLNAMLYGQEWNWTECVSEFEKAVRSNPEYPTAHHWYSETLVFLGRDDEAAAHINRALELDPLSFAILNDAVTINWYAGRYEDAIKKAEKMMTFDKRYESQARLWLTRLHYHTGSIARARQEFKIYESLAGKVSEMDYANNYAMLGEREKSLFYLKKVENSMTDLRESWMLAGTYAVLGMREETFKWLEVALEIRNPSIIALGANPDFDRFRDDPRYWNLLGKMNLAEFWREKLNK